MARALPLLRTWTPGDLATAAYMNAMNYGITWGGISPPQCLAWQNTPQAFTTGIAAGVTFDSEVVDSDSMHSTVTNTQNIVAPWAGWYELAGGIGFATNGTGTRVGQFTVNGTAQGLSSVIAIANASANILVPLKTIRVLLAAGDAVALSALQNSGGSLSTVAQGSYMLMSYVSQ